MMRSHLLLGVVTLCICLGMIYTESDEVIKQIEKVVRDDIYAVSETFADDIMKMVENTHNNSYVFDVFCEAVSFNSEQIDVVNRKIPKDKSSKIDVNQVKDFQLKKLHSSAGDKAEGVENLKILQSILSKRFQPERYNGLINLIFVCAFDYATTDEIQSALNYLYGIDTEATKTSFLDAYNIPNPTGEADCPSDYQQYSSTIDELSRLDGIKPKVMQDFSAVREKFPCNDFAIQSLKHFVYIIQRLDGNKSKINACMIKESPGNWASNLPYRHNSKEYMESELEASKSILSTRLPDETIRGIINFTRATIPDTPIDEIEKALEYLYEDVPKKTCSATESTTEAK